jgi:type II secretory pathway pseudopilin PulG
MSICPPPLPRRRHSQGFTLIELLIAGTILFAVITTVTEAYRTSLQSSLRAEETVRMITPLRFIVSDIANQLKTSANESSTGGGKILGVEYRFAAQSVLFTPPATRFDPDTSNFRTYPARYRLYDVDLTVTYRGRSREFQYQELAWTDRAN